MKCDCGCHCIRCKSTDLESFQTGSAESDGYFDMHHTCKKCHAHFDHLDGTIFDKCDVCRYGN
ncbi:MAG: hypothetical protein EPO63_06745 [Candidatus Nitrosotenuis sp.]|nr:MAG: hypothetical protein EPO63_06745 [Candidatus Nitrosotenuis sp.]